MIVQQHEFQHRRNVPHKLRNLPWMGTRFAVGPKERLNKPPYRVRAGLPIQKADKTDPENHASFEEACDALERGRVDAVGVVITDEDSLTVVDMDSVINPETGEIDSEAHAVLASFNSYTETSVSETGLHIICEAKKPGTRCKGGNLELYDGQRASPERSGHRFLVVTGKHLPGTPAEIHPRQEVVERLYNDLFPEDRGERALSPRRTGVAPLRAEEILKRARNAKNGNFFRELYDQGYRRRGDNNRDDFDLINILIFWCAGDEDMVIYLFKRSAMYRPPPEKDRGYVQRSVKRALETYKGSYFHPKALKEASPVEKEDILTPYLQLLMDPSYWTGPRGASGWKAYVALVLKTAEDGISTDAKDLRVGVDVRTLAERAGQSRSTLCESALPHLTEKKLITWCRGKGTKAGTFILKKPSYTSRSTKERGHFSGPTCVKHLKALKQLVRMRPGKGDADMIARLGMVAMFVLTSLVKHPRGLNADELAEATGRRKDTVRRALKKLLDTGIVAERSGRYALARDFWERYECELEESGITRAERLQKKRHETDREERRRALRQQKVVSIQLGTDRKKKRESAGVGEKKTVQLTRRFDPRSPDRSSEDIIRGRREYQFRCDEERERDRQLEVLCGRVGEAVSESIKREIRQVVAEGMSLRLACREVFRSRGVGGSS